MAPRQLLSATPYALGLRAGAVIDGTLADESVLRLKNNVGDALQIDRGYNGIQIDSATNNGLQIGYADGVGVRVEEARDYGIHATTTFTDAVAVYGSASASTGFVYGVRGFANSADGAGVRGDGVSGGKGIYGSASDGVGVYGSSIFGGVGVHGTGFNNDTGVLGDVDDGQSFGVIGIQDGYDTSDTVNLNYWQSGGFFGGRNGVVGVTKESGGFAVFGYNQASADFGWAGRFIADDANGVWISTPADQTGLTVSGGSKNAVVATGDGARLLYAEEATEVWFSDYGFGALQDGIAIVAVDPIFAETVNLDEPYHVFIQAYSDAELYVTNRTATGFEVHLRDGDPSAEFSYRLVARRLGFENDRLERAPWADNDPNLFPEKQAALALEQGEQP